MAKSDLDFGKTITIYGQYQGNNNVLASTYNFKPLDQQLGLHPVYPLIEGFKTVGYSSDYERGAETCGYSASKSTSKIC